VLGADAPVPRARRPARHPCAPSDGPLDGPPRSGARLKAALAALAFLALAVASRGARADEPTTPEPTPASPEPARAAGQDDEVVEIVDEGASPSGPARAMPSAEPAKNDKIELRGFARTTLAVGVDPDGAAPTNAAPQERVGYERATSVNQAYIDVRYTRGRTFQAVLSGSLAYTAAMVEGAAGQSADSRDFHSVLVEPLLREAYLGFYSSRVDVRLGQQRIVWGNSDAVTPNDVLNARDTRNRMQLDPEMYHIPTLAARADFDLGIAVLGVVAQPFFVPDRASIYGGNWSLVQPGAPLHVRKFFGTYSQGQDPSDVESSLVRAKAAQAAFDGASIGASLRFHFGSVDASYYYHYGRDRSPYVYLDPNVANQLSTATSDQDYAAIYASQQKASSSYGGPFVVESVRRHHVGADLATTAGSFVLRLDTAFDTAMTFYTQDTLNSIARPAVQAVAGVEYQRGLGKVIIFEATYMHLFDPEIPVVPTSNRANGGPLLFVQPNNVGVVNVIRWSFLENIVFEARTLLGVQPFSWMVRPEIGYGTSNFTIRLGYLALDGVTGSFGGYYHRNQNVYLTTRYSF
jgi:hypothetical protein